MLFFAFFRSLLQAMKEKLRAFWNAAWKRWRHSIVGSWFHQLKWWFQAAIILPVGGLSLILLFYLSVLIGLLGPVPKQKDFVNLEQSSATRIVSREGKLLGKLYDINRTYIPIDSIPKKLLKALVATEDARFYQHKGVDNLALIRVLFKTILLQKDAGGGSTISQQLVKNVFGRQMRHGSLSLYVVKLKEMIGARRIERLYGKDKILELYLNSVPFGENVYGIESAAERFFSTTTSNLSLGQSAVLVGMLKANTYYSPRLHPERSEDRRNLVLRLMEQQGFISQESLDSALKSELKLVYNRDETHEVASQVVREIAARAKQLLQDKTKRNGEKYDLKMDGLVIHTTISGKMQQMAEESMRAHLASLQPKLDANWGQRRPWGRKPQLLKQAIKQSARYQNLKKAGRSEEQIMATFSEKTPSSIYYHSGVKHFSTRPIDSLKHTLFQLRAGLMAVQHQTGEVLAWVGSPNHAFFQYDYVKAKRQVASTFKPIVFATALQKGYEPCDFFRNEKTVYTDYQDWSPENFSKRYGGKYSMKGALANSVNVVAVNLLYKSKRENVIALARELGIESDIPDFPSIALGVADISLYEMIHAYSTFANSGYKPKMLLITKIENRAGELLYKANFEKSQVLDEDDALRMRAMLQGVVQNGTGKALKSTYKVQQEMAGKTGTAQNHADGWFIGFTPKITVGVWVGGDQRDVRFTTGTYGQGARMALPIVGELVSAIEKDSSLKAFTQAHFPPLSTQLKRELDCADFEENNTIDDIIDVFRDKEVSDEKLQKRNKRQKFWKRIFK